MKFTPSKDKNILFVFINNQPGHLWIWDGSQYLRFYCNAENYWFIRAQTQLPANCEGLCLKFFGHDYQLIQNEARRHRLSLPFHEDEESSRAFALRARRETPVFGSDAPAGYFFLSDLSRRRRGED